MRRNEAWRNNAHNEKYHEIARECVYRLELAQDQTGYISANVELHDFKHITALKLLAEEEGYDLEGLLEQAVGYYFDLLPAMGERYIEIKHAIDCA